MAGSVQMLYACMAACLLAGAAAEGLMSLKAAAQQIAPWLVSVRRELHQIPELLFEEHKTSAKLREHLKAMDIQVQYPYAKTGEHGTDWPGQTNCCVEG